MKINNCKKYGTHVDYHTSKAEACQAKDTYLHDKEKEEMICINDGCEHIESEDDLESIV